MTSHKKGFLFAMMLLVIGIIVFGFISLWGYKILSDMSPDILIDLESNESKAALTEVNDRYPSSLDGLFILLFVGLITIGIVSAFISDTHPILFAFMMMIMIFMIIAGTILGNFYEAFFTDAEFGTLTDSFPMTHWVLTHMLIVGIFAATIIMLILLGKNRL